MIWRPSAAAQIGLATLVIGFVAFAIGVVIDAARDGVLLQGLAFATVLLIASCLPIRFMQRARIELADRELVITTTLSEHRLDLAEIRDARAGYYGITVTLEDGRTVLSGAVQKSNASKWSNTHTRADDVVDAILDRVQRTES